MKTFNNKEKRTYAAPEIEIIRLDNGISLAMDSEPPMGPGESNNQLPNGTNNNPFKTTMA